jgi:threonine/homoserine/homoserine lactone efflux protein
MLHLIMIVLPLGLSAAVSPVMLSEQVVVVGGPGGRRAGTLYALGTVLVLVPVIVAVALLGRSVGLPSAPHLDATADIVLGVLLLGAALGVARVHRHPAPDPHPERAPSEPERGPMSPRVALGFGVVSMATNFTTLTIVVVAVKDVVAADKPVAESVVALAVLLVLATAPAWLPVLLSALPGHANAALAAISGVVSRHGRQLAVLVLIAVGAFLVIRGVVHLAGL